MAAAMQNTACAAGCCHESMDSLLMLIQNLNKTKCENKKIELLKLATESLHRWNRELIHSFLQTSNAPHLFTDAARLAVPAQFPDRGHYIFEKDDFRVLAERTEVVLSFLHKILEICNENGEDKNCSRAVDPCLPILLLIISSNIRNSLWSTESVQKLTLYVSDQLRILYKVDSLSELLMLDFKTIKSRDRGAASPESCLLGQYLKTVQVRLDKHNWQANPTFIESFYWMLTRLMKFPLLSDYLDKVLPPSLMFIDSHVTEHRVMGIKCLQHIAAETSKDRLRWYDRAEVIYAALKQQIYSREPEIVGVLHPALLTVLPIIDKNPARPVSLTSPKELDSILSIIITSAVTENNLVLRRLYTQYIADFVDVLDVSVVRHLGKLLGLVSDYLEVFDGPTEEARFNALKILQSVLQNAWPRIPGHAEQILCSLLKLVQDLVCDKSTTPDKVKDKLTEKAVLCLSMLKELCPSVQLYLQTLCESKELSDVASVVQDLIGN